MRTDIAVGHQSLAWQIDDDALGVLVGKVKYLPVVLAQFVHTRHQHRLHPWARWQIADDSQDTRRQKERARAAHQEAQRIAARHQIILAPGIRKLFAPLLIFSSACWLRRYSTVWSHIIIHRCCSSSVRTPSATAPTGWGFLRRGSASGFGAVSGGDRGVQGCGGTWR